MFKSIRITPHLLVLMIALMLSLIGFVGIVFAQGDAIKQNPFDPITLVALIYNLVMGALSVPITSWIKAKVVVLADKGWLVPLVNGGIGIVFVAIGNWVFGWHIFTNPDLWNTVVVALGINQTVATVTYELFKKKKPVTP